MKEWIYLDNAATTPLKKEVYESMQPFLKESYGNPSGFSSFSDKSKLAIDKSREIISDFLGALREEIYFTSGGTESDNWAIKGVAFANKDNGKHIITSKIEHHAVLNTCKWLEKQGFEVTYLDVDENGMVDPAEVENAIRKDTILVSIMFANNEIGTIEPIREIGKIAKKHGVLFHTDAVQAFGHVPINVDECNIDLLSASAHKINGPKGCGILYIRRGTKIDSLQNGGDQENGKRGGTYNVPGIVGFGEAARIAKASLDDRTIYETNLRDHMIDRILDEIPYCRLNGHRTNRLPNNADISFRYIEGESMLIKLDQHGICASSGSACTSGSLDPSHVLLAIGLPHEIAHGSLRLTICEDTTKNDINYMIDTLKDIVAKLRSMSPLYEDFVKEVKDVQ